MNIIRFLAFALTLSALNGCVYLDVQTPLDKDVNKTEIGSKTGYAKAQSVLWLFAWGDAGTAAAARDGGITVVNHLDAHYYSILFGLYSSRETIAYGD